MLLSLKPDNPDTDGYDGGVVQGNYDNRCGFDPNNPQLGTNNEQSDCHYYAADVNTGEVWEAWHAYGVGKQVGDSAWGTNAFSSGCAVYFDLSHKVDWEDYEYCTSANASGLPDVAFQVTPGEMIHEDGIQHALACQTYNHLLAGNKFVAATSEHGGAVHVATAPENLNWEKDSLAWHPTVIQADAEPYPLIPYDDGLVNDDICTLTPTIGSIDPVTGAVVTEQTAKPEYMHCEAKKPMYGMRLRLKPEIEPDSGAPNSVRKLVTALQTYGCLIKDGTTGTSLSFSLSNDRLDSADWNSVNEGAAEVRQLDLERWIKNGTGIEIDDFEVVAFEPEYLGVPVPMPDDAESPPIPAVADIPVNTASDVRDQEPNETDAKLCRKPELPARDASGLNDLLFASRGATDLDDPSHPRSGSQPAAGCCKDVFGNGTECQLPDYEANPPIEGITTP